MVTAADPSAADPGAANSGAADADERQAPGGAGTRAALILRVRPAWPAIGLAVAGLLLFAAYYVQARSAPALSSSAGQALQAWQMWHGNPLLRGWTLSDVSFCAAPARRFTRPCAWGSHPAAWDQARQPVVYSR